VQRDPSEFTHLIAGGLYRGKETRVLRCLLNGTNCKLVGVDMSDIDLSRRDERDILWHPCYPSSRASGPRSLSMPRTNPMQLFFQRN